MLIPVRLLLVGGFLIALVAMELRANAQTAPDPPSKTAGAKETGAPAKKATGTSSAKAASDSQKTGSGDQNKAKPSPASSAKSSPPKDAAKTASNKSAGPKPAAAAKTGKSAAPKAAVTKATVASIHADGGAAPAPAAPSGVSAADLATVKRAIPLAQQGKTALATDEQQSITDPAARKIVEWAILRSDDNGVEFSRYAAFIAANPTWPSIGLLRRRAEAILWQEYPGPGTVLAFFSREPPLSAKGRFALARALLSQGDSRRAQALVREAWHHDPFSSDVEAQALDAFGHLLDRTDHKARMDMRLYADDVEAAMRAANRAGGLAPAIARARAAIIKKVPNAKELLDELPAEAQRDPGVVFNYAQLLRRADDTAAAAQLLLSLPHDPSAALDADQWWIERRLTARKLLDLGDARSAYLIARDAAPPARENYRVEHEFTAGWIALRFLQDPATAHAHFARISAGTANPISLARAHYWQGRAAEAMGRTNEAHVQYQEAARYPTAYYGQIARARLGLKDLVLRSPPQRPSASHLEVLRAIEILYAAGERNLVTGIAADLGERWDDAGALAALGEVTAHYHDARAMLHVGKLALGRGMSLEHYAFPTVGIPSYKAVGPGVDTSVIYAIARQESTFYQGTVSSAKAMGLMQVTPDAGRYVAKKFGVKYDGKRLLSDPVYNVQLGAAELGELIQDYRGSYILAFAGYNAGRGRVRDWVARYGDPRDPEVDPIDWIERIPFAETRNYVQRVLENLQVYRVRFGGNQKLLIEADLRRGAS